MDRDNPRARGFEASQAGLVLASLARNGEEAGALGRGPGDPAVVVDISRDDEDRVSGCEVIQHLDRGRWSLPDYGPKPDAGDPYESYDLIVVVDAQHLAAHRSSHI